MNSRTRPAKLPVKILFSAITLSLSIALSACGDSRSTADEAANANKDSSQETSGPMTAPQTDTPNSAQTPSGGNPYEVAGIDNPDKFNEFFDKVQRDVAAGDKEQVAADILYPLRVNENGKSKDYKDKEEFIAHYDSIMTDSVKKALADQKREALFVNAQGVMAGNGEIWFGASADQQDQYGIIAINKN
ncbi:hypothetical protein P9847_00075 [Paenibacillus chibensis]|uniref:Uncharacterized protein n=1 Tax=Paenibacillus chibensis TaxID=59846 RepID=A0ABU6PLM1_9BACL|nr:hypothetical protein [Paenibacillus chibensis]